MSYHIKKYHHWFTAGILFLLFPLLVHAQSVRGIFRRLTDVTKLVIPVLMSLCVAVFLWGIVRFILAGGSPERMKTAKNLIIWGLVGIFVLITFWGLIQVLLLTFLGTSSPPSTPGDWPPRAF